MPSKNVLSEKQAYVAGLREKMAASVAGVVVDYKGITVADDTLVNRRAILGPSQVTDAYLLALAVRHEDRLVTLDRRIALALVKGATSDHLAVV